MVSSSQIMSLSSNLVADQEEKTEQEPNVDQYKETISTLPKVKDWSGLEYIHQYQGFWNHAHYLQAIMSAQQHFNPQPCDIIVSSLPKSGSTWLKALAFSITTRNRYINDFTSSPLFTKISHDCVPRLEVYLAGEDDDSGRRKREVPLVATHLPFASLPKSIIDSDNKIVYICRDPKAVFVSLWHFFYKAFSAKGIEILPLGKALEQFCEGYHFFGPYWDHVLGYWKASLEQPEKVLFMKYEEMKKDGEAQVKRLAEFMGYPFSLEEEKNGDVENIIRTCSFEFMSNLEINKNGKRGEDTPFPNQNSSYFRKGDVGDWKNHLTAEMAARIDSIWEQKFLGSGLNLTCLP